MKPNIIIKYFLYTSGYMFYIFLYILNVGKSKCVSKINKLITEV